MNLKGLTVSAAGLEPATHALKEQQGRGLPRIFNNLRSHKGPQIGGNGWWSGLNRHANKHWPPNSREVSSADELSESQPRSSGRPCSIRIASIFSA
jgi:hypothetical protein